MKKSFFTVSVCCILFFTLCHQANAGPNDPVSIPDPNLLAAIRTKLSKPTGNITESDMNGMTGELLTNNQSGNRNSITDLTGLEHATGVTRLAFTRENISVLTPLAGLTQLTSLGLYDNKATLDLTSLKNLTNLQYLILRRRTHLSDAPSPITDISALKNLTKLIYLDLTGQRVSSLSVLADKTALTTLNLGDNREDGKGTPLDLSHLSNLTKLTRLDLEDCDVRDISPLSSLTSLETVDLSGNTELRDISTVASFTSLQELLLGATKITETGLSAVIPSLPSSLFLLDLTSTAISDLSVLENLASGVKLTKLDVDFMHHSLSADANDRGQLLKDISPLVDLMNAGKIGAHTSTLELRGNWLLDYDSLYTHIPALIAGGIPGVKYPGIAESRVTPELRGRSAEDYKGRPGTRHTFVVQARTTFEDYRHIHWSSTLYTPHKVNSRFAGVPVTWTITAPDGTVSETEAVTRYDGLTRVSVTLGGHGDMHTAEAVVPATTHANGPTHPELRVSFTATADRDAPIPSGLHVTFEDYPEIPPTDEFNLTIIFSEPVTGFQMEDITVETELETGTGTATLKTLTLPTEPTQPTQIYTATIGVPADETGTVRLIVHAGAALGSISGQVGPATDTPSEPIEFGHPKRGVVVFLPSHVAMDKVMFTEFRNVKDDKKDWIELKNISDEEVSLVDWEVSIVESEGEHRNTDREIVAFPDYTLPAGGILLIVNSHPNETDLIQGQDIESRKHNPNLHPQYLIAPEMKLPDSPYLLILRSVRDKNGKPEAFEDLAGDYHRSDVNYFTNVWPLQHTPVYTGTEAKFAGGEVWERVDLKARGYRHKAWALSTYQAGLGYDPNASPETSLGTPGYSEAVMTTEAGSGQISFSEVMFATDEAGAPSQWIELYNNSTTEIVDLEGWQLVIEARYSPPVIGIPYRNRYTRLTFKPLEIMPNQTVLLVTRNDRNSGNIPMRRIYDVFQQNSEALPPKWAKRKLLGAGGFALRLLSPDGTLVDIAGNLDGKPSRDTPQWALPEGWTETGARSSLIRVYEDRVPALGTVSEGWVRAADTALLIGYTYWGVPTDDGTPGYRQGSPLPVTLSSFGAARQDGAVVVRWTTESEMANAGFYVLRSRERSSGFEGVSPSLIVGAGTTGERNTYIWQDTTAKADVPYYYRLEEVSLSGERRAIATARLRGHLSATGKLLGKWADVKTTAE